MKLNHIWTVFCRKGIVDEQTRLMSLIEVVEEITFTIPSNPDQKNLPTIAAGPFELITLWARSNFETPMAGKARVKFFSPNSKDELMFLNEEIDLKKFRRTRIKRIIPQLKFLGTGNHYFLVEIYDPENDIWEKAATIPVEFRESKQE